MKKHITVKIYEELKRKALADMINEGPVRSYKYELLNVEWVDNNGVNTPYFITYK